MTDELEEPYGSIWQLAASIAGQMKGDEEYAAKVRIARKYGVEPDEVLFRWSDRSIASEIALQMVEAERAAGECSSCGTHSDDWHLWGGGRADEPRWIIENVSCVGCQRMAEHRQQHEKTLERYDHLTPRFLPNPKAKHPGSSS